LVRRARGNISCVGSGLGATTVCGADVVALAVGTLALGLVEFLVESLSGHIASSGFFPHQEFAITAFMDSSMLMGLPSLQVGACGLSRQ